MAIVVSPLIALMHDQVGALDEAGVSAAFLNSTLSFDQAQDVELRLQTGDITLLYVAPERLNTPRFLGLLDDLYQQQKLSLFAIDEAHCVSQWGHDFRPEYRALSVLHERYAGVPRIALTATADDLTRADIVERLLAYFGEPSTPCGNCDNCISPPDIWGAPPGRSMTQNGACAVMSRTCATHCAACACAQPRSTTAPGGRVCRPGSGVSNKGRVMAGRQSERWQALAV